MSSSADISGSCRQETTAATIVSGRAGFWICFDRARCAPSSPRFRRPGSNSFHSVFSRSCAVPLDDCQGAHQILSALPGCLYLAAPAPTCSCATSRVLTFFLFPAAFSSAFTRTRFAPLLAATAAAFFATAFVRFVNRCPCASRRFFFAHTALLVTARDLLRFALLLPRIFLFAPSCHKTFPPRLFAHK